MQAFLSVDADSYRGFKHPWIGAPVRPPDIHTIAVWNDTDVLTIVHVSWNGATEVSQWHFKMLDARSSKFVGTAERTGFETRFLHRGYIPDIFVEAYDRHGGFLGRSEVYHTAPPVAMGEELVPSSASSLPFTWFSAGTLCTVLFIAACGALFGLAIARFERHQSKHWQKRQVQKLD
jgi:hypothetical protein